MAPLSAPPLPSGHRLTRSPGGKSRSEKTQPPHSSDVYSFHAMCADAWMKNSRGRKLGRKLETWRIGKLREGWKEHIQCSCLPPRPPWTQCRGQLMSLRPSCDTSMHWTGVVSPTCLASCGIFKECRVLFWLVQMLGRGCLNKDARPGHGLAGPSMQ